MSFNFNCYHKPFYMNKKVCIREEADVDEINRCIRDLKEVERVITRLTGVFKLAGSDARLKILYLLAQNEHFCVCDLADILNMSIPAVSQHLRKLKDGGLVETARDGQTIFYSLDAVCRQLLLPHFSHINTNQIMEIEVV